MRKLFVLLLILITSCYSFAQQADKAKQLDGVFRMLYEQNQFSGNVLIADKGRIVFQKSYGLRDEMTGKLTNSQTIFELGSVSKQFTAAAIVMLVREGKLSYEDKLSKYIPELAFWNEVTIYNLLRHTSGLPEFLIEKDWNKEKINTNQDLINLYASRKPALEFAPGSRHQYCNTNYALLASIIEKASGEKYADYLSGHIFKPLKMKRTFVYNRRQSLQKIGNYATGYVWARNSFQKVTSEQPEYDDRMVYYLDGIVGAAKVNSTTGDLLKWINALKNNTLITKKEFEAMTETTKTTGGKNIPYGFGFDVSKGKDKFSFGHTGSWDGYVSFIYQNMTTDRTIIILENFKLGTYPFDNINQVLDGKPLSAKYKTKIALPESEISRYTGVYVDGKNKEEQHLITYKNGHLFYNTNKIKWDMRFFPTSQNEFQGIRQGGVDGVMKFTDLSDGTTKLEMLQYGEIIGTGIKTNKN
jgi:CubicO group peptidase (beta-lactamase class C family)